MRPGTDPRLLAARRSTLNVFLSLDCAKESVLRRLLDVEGLNSPKSPFSPRSDEERPSNGRRHSRIGEDVASLVCVDAIDNQFD